MVSKVKKRKKNLPDAFGCDEVVVIDGSGCGSESRQSRLGLNSTLIT